MLLLIRMLCIIIMCRAEGCSIENCAGCGDEESCAASANDGSHKCGWDSVAQECALQECVLGDCGYTIIMKMAEDQELQCAPASSSRRHYKRPLANYRLTSGLSKTKNLQTARVTGAARLFLTNRIHEMHLEM